jgi:hypothetical protein
MSEEPKAEDQGEGTPDVFPYYHYGWDWPSREPLRYSLAVFGEPEPPSLAVATFDDQGKVVAKSTWPGSVRDVTSETLRDWLDAQRIEAEAVDFFAKVWELRPQAPS